MLDIPCIGIQNLQTIEHPNITLATNFNKYSLIIFVSVNAVVSFFNLFGADVLENISATKVLAIGSTTAQSLESYVMQKVIYPPSEYEQNSEGFLNLPALADTTKDHILLVRGDTSRDYIATDLASRSASFSELMTYQTVALDFDLSWTKNLPDNLIIIITSMKILENFYDKITNSSLSKNIIAAILKSQLLVISKRIYDQADKLGFKNINLSNSMSDDAIIGIIDRIERN